jgi:hypothetical protein
VRGSQFGEIGAEVEQLSPEQASALLQHLDRQRLVADSDGAGGRVSSQRSGSFLQQALLVVALLALPDQQRQHVDRGLKERQGGSESVSFHGVDSSSTCCSDTSGSRCSLHRRCFLLRCDGFVENGAVTVEPEPQAQRVRQVQQHSRPIGVPKRDRRHRFTKDFRGFIEIRCCCRLFEPG